MVYFIGRLFLILILTVLFVFGGTFVLTDDVMEAFASNDIISFDNDDNNDPNDPNTPPPRPGDPIPCPLPPNR